MTTTISALTNQQPKNADVLEFEVLNTSSWYTTKAQLLTAAPGEAIALAGAGSSVVQIGVTGVITLTAGAPASGAGLNVNLTASAAFAGSGAAGGNVVVTPGAGDGSASVTTNTGKFIIQNPDGNANHQVQVCTMALSSK
jgi:hypothetical protein